MLVEDDFTECLTPLVAPMQFLHGLTTMHSVILKYAETRSAWEAKVKEVEDRVVSVERDCSEAIKLKEYMVAWLKAEGEIIKESDRATNVAARLDHYEVLRRLAKNRAQANKERARSIEGWAKVIEDRAKFIKEKATSIVVRAVEEYKDSDAFMVDATMIMAGIYVINFDDWKVKVAEVYPDINLHHITPTGRTELTKEEENE